MTYEPFSVLRYFLIFLISTDHKKKARDKKKEEIEYREKKREDKARENVWEARKNQALLDASKVERGILKDILFSETTSKTPTGYVREDITILEIDKNDNKIIKAALLDLLTNCYFSGIALSQDAVRPSTRR